MLMHIPGLPGGFGLQFRYELTLKKVRFVELMVGPRFQKKSLFLLGIVLTAASVVAGQAKPTNDPDEAAIRGTALDYIDGFYTGDGARMERALHPELAKRIVTTDAKTGKSKLEQMSAMTLVQLTRTGIGKLPEERRQHDVTILDRFEETAVVKLVATEWVDYLHMAKYDGQWKIVNVLWVWKPGVQAQAETSPGANGSSDVQNYRPHHEIGSWMM